MSRQAVLITGRSRSGCRPDLLALFARYGRAPVRSQSYRPLVVWCADDVDSDVFHIFEMYADRATFDEAALAPSFLDYLKAADSMLDGQPDLVLATPLWCQGVDCDSAQHVERQRA